MPNMEEVRMSEVADLELCRELYELSGWGSEHENAMWCWVEAHQEYDIDNGTMLDEQHPPYPAYTLGYLLRKLPPVVTLKSRAGKRWCAHCFTGRMAEDGDGIVKVDQSFTADTPENAAAALAINLFKQGVLTREEV